MYMHALYIISKVTLFVCCLEKMFVTVVTARQYLLCMHGHRGCLNPLSLYFSVGYILLFFTVWAGHVAVYRDECVLEHLVGTLPNICTMVSALTCMQIDRWCQYSYMRAIKLRMCKYSCIQLDKATMIYCWYSYMCSQTTSPKNCLSRLCAVK